MTFLLSAIEKETDDCIEWPFGKSVGYGTIWFEGGNRLCTNLVMEMTGSPQPADGMDVAHSPVICHNRSCINRRHLRWATHVENLADKVKDGTDHRGDKHGMAKLTNAQAVEIRDAQEPAKVLAHRYCVDVSHIYKIRRGSTRKWG